jgi:acid phosphatase
MEKFLQRAVVLFAAVFLVVSLTGCSTPQPPANLGLLKNEVREYYSSGDYDKGCQAVGKKAMKQLKAWQGKKKTAIVLDIDDTSICTYPEMVANDFGYNETVWNAWATKADAPAIEPTLNLVKQALEQDTAVFFITGRKEKLRKATEETLLNAGYPRWTSLIMEPDDYKGNAVDYKTPERRKIVEDMGYTIIINMGDQLSDLEGGYAENTYKLPNPCYYIP